MTAMSTRESSQSRCDSDLEKGEPCTTTLKPISAISRRLNEELSIDGLGIEIMIILCWFVTGFLDSTIFNAYRTFVSMQTGNTIFIGLGATNNVPTNRPYGWLKSLSSLLTFVIACLVFSRLSKSLGPLKRLTFLTSFVIQTSLCIIAAILVQTDWVESRLEYLGEDIDFMHLLPIILLSFQAPGQTCLGRQVGRPEVPTVVVTTMVYDFASDERLFAWGGWFGFKKGGSSGSGKGEGGRGRCSNRDGEAKVAIRQGNAKRNRRFIGWATMLLGAIAGGGVTVWTGHIVVSLWGAAVVKGAMTIAWVFWPKRKAGAGEDER